MALAQISAEQMERARTAPAGTVLLDEVIGDGAYDEQLTLGDLIPDPNVDVEGQVTDALYAQQQIEALYPHLCSLDLDERRVIGYRYGIGETFRGHSQRRSRSSWSSRVALWLAGALCTDDTAHRLSQGCGARW